MIDIELRDLFRYTSWLINKTLKILDYDIIDIQSWPLRRIVLALKAFQIIHLMINIIEL
jgi:hypothetical protein